MFNLVTCRERERGRGRSEAGGLGEGKSTRDGCGYELVLDVRFYIIQGGFSRKKGGGPRGDWRASKFPK